MNRLMSRRTAALVPAVIVVLAAVSRAGEENVPLDKVPKAVLVAVKARFPKAKPVSAGKETEDGKTVYEVAIKDGDQPVDVTLTPDGTVVEIEKRIAAADLPRAVAKALEDKYPKAAYKVVEEVIKVKDGKEKLEYYEVLLVTAGKKKLEVAVTPAGELVKEEAKGGKDD
jgi:hypothetical protein